MTNVSKISHKSKRARSAITRDQSKRALIVNAVQFLLAANIAAVIAYKTGWETLITWRNPVTILFMSYAAFWLWTTLRAAQKRLQWYDLAISIALDFALCLELLLFQYANSENSFGVAPMFSYVFLMVAMRALHFDPLLILLAGICAATGWTATVWITLIANQTALSQYTFREILLSGIVEKYVVIIGITLVLAYTTKRARQYFEASIVRALAGQGLAKFIGNEIASKIVMAAGELKPGQGRMARAAILMIDLKNFTETASTMKPSAVMTMLQEYQSFVAPIITARGGIIDKFMGDGILAHFGAISPSMTYAADALVTIEEVLFRSAQWKEARKRQGLPAVDVKAACAVGDIIFGTVGGGGRLEFTIIGDAVNTTAKLEKYTAKLGARALVTGRAFDTAKMQGYIPQGSALRHNNHQVPTMTRPVDLVMISPPTAIAQPRYEAASKVS